MVETAAEVAVADAAAVVVVVGGGETAVDTW